MTKKNNKTMSEVLGGNAMRVVAKKARVATRKAKAKTKLTTEQAKQAIKSVSDQVAGTKEPTTPEIDTPRITNETVAKEREKVLSGARRFIYPLQSRKRVVLVSLGIITSVFVLIILFTALLLYGFKSTNGFAYNVSRFVPFPVARVAGEFVPYENYLFEVRNTVFYLANYAQEGTDIDSSEGRALINDTKNKILEKIQRDELARQLAAAAEVKITDEDIANQIEQFEIRGGIDQSQGTLESVLAKYYDWDLGDLERVVELQLIYQKLLPILDETANNKVSSTLAEIEAGYSFAGVAGKRSEDTTSKSNGGIVGNVKRSNNSYSDELSVAIFNLDAGEVSDPIVAPRGYYIFKVNKVIDKNSVNLSQIFIRFFDLDAYLAEKLNTVAHRVYITID